MTSKQYVNTRLTDEGPRDKLRSGRRDREQSMGKAKTQRTEALHNAARRYVLAKQAEQAIAQHNLDKLVRSGVIMTEPTKEGGLRERLYPPRRRGRL